MKHATMRSARLQRVVAILRDGKPHSTWEIMRRGKVCAVNSLIAELRCNGAVIDCDVKVEGPDRERRYYYTMKKGPRQDG